MISFRGCKWQLCALALALVLAIVLRLENEMVSKVGTLLSGSQQTWSQSAGLQSPTSSQRSHPTNDWFQEDDWHSNHFTKECWHVEDICHSAHRWFYDPRSLNPEHQPPFSIGLYQTDLTALRIKATSSSSSSSSTFLGRPKQLILKTPRSNATFDRDDLDFADEISPFFLQTCKYSPVVNHVVLQSFYNDMLGEFYSRSLAYIYKIYDAVTRNREDQNDEQDGQSDGQIENSFPEQTQMYLHVRNFPEHAKLLDSHHVFTDAFRSNALLSFTYLLDYTGCRCMKRLFLCGYDEKDTKNRAIFGNLSTITELVPAGNSGPSYLERDYPNIFRDLRKQLRRTVVESNPFIQQDIAEYRAEAIRQHRPKLKSLTPKLVSEFRVVGLTQRKGRRKWLDLAQIIRLCNTKWFSDSDKIVCVETNLEEDDVNPVRQVVIHAACDMLFGIHGAQLSEAIWMKDGSAVVELLPWIPTTASYGSWTRTTEMPTPLGQIFKKCTLNHIGYPLPRESAPYCQDKSNDEASLKRCFSNHLWDDRNFLVDPKVILDMIQKFAPNLSDSKHKDDVLPITSCEELQQKAGNRVYVLYNVVCANQTDRDSQLAPYVHHFCWPKDLNLTIAKMKLW